VERHDLPAGRLMTIPGGKWVVTGNITGPKLLAIAAWLILAWSAG
jgi:hypothetical protein